MQNTPDHPPYSLVWKTIKKAGSVDIQADPKIHKRIKKAVIKKKNEDLIYAMNLRDQAQYSKLVISSAGWILSFRLKTFTIDLILERSLGNL